VICIVCAERRANQSLFCKQCGDSYDRSRTKDDGTIVAALEWAAKRSRWFERRRWRARMRKT